MSYILADAGGVLGDFTSNEGLADLRALDLPALAEFLDAGGADEALQK